MAVVGGEYILRNDNINVKEKNKIEMQLTLSSEMMRMVRLVKRGAMNMYVYACADVYVHECKCPPECLQIIRKRSVTFMFIHELVVGILIAAQIQMSIFPF